jgi:putative lipoic acid-binding regulatory protein
LKPRWWRWRGTSTPASTSPAWSGAPVQGGKYLGLTLTVTATSREQLDELYRTLSTHPMVKVVL